MKHKNILSYIAKDIQKQCERLGIYAEFTPTDDEKRIVSSDFKMQPAIFESIHVEGLVYIESDDDRDDLVVFTVSLSYRYTHWDGGENGCRIGYADYQMLKSNYDKDKAYLDDRFCLIEKLRGISL